VYLRVVLIHSEGATELPNWAQTRIEQLAHLAMVRNRLDLRHGDPWESVEGRTQLYAAF
jgi:hypothetical protein